MLQCSAEDSAFDLECANIVERDLADADLQDEVQETVKALDTAAKLIDAVWLAL